MKDIATAVRHAMGRYLTEVDPDPHALRVREQETAVHLNVLPVSSEWTGFFGLREDGTVVWVSEEIENPESDPNVSPWARHMALIKAARRFPELAPFSPQPNDSWTTCTSCNGTGCTSGGRWGVSSTCRCLGFGRLPSEVQSFIETTGRLY